MSKKQVNVHVGTLEDMGQRFTRAWKQVERGEKVREEHLTFPDLATLLNALSPKRVQLLRAVHQEPARSVKALAERLKRDYKRVHGDVETLAELGLLQRNDGHVAAAYDVIHADLDLRSAA
jgi:predicted transcriptional regulator